MRQRKRVPGWVAALGVLIAALIIAGPGPLREAEQVGTRVIAPLQFGLSRTAAGVGDLFETVNAAGALAAQNRLFREELERYKQLESRLRELEMENRDLRSLLGLQDVAPPGSQLPANVIARDPITLLQSIVIDRGWEDGVKVNHPVITSRGLAGRVAEVNPRSAKVLLITDVNSAVAVRVQDPASRATGILRGTADGRMVLQYVPRTDALKTDDVLITSGIGGTFPPGLEVGRILYVRQKDVEVFQEALVEPAVDIRNLERIYVLLAPVESGERPAN